MNYFITELKMKHRQRVNFFWLADLNNNSVIDFINFHFIAIYS